MSMPYHARLLVVDDDDNFRDILVRRSSQCGYAVFGAADGQAALRASTKRAEPQLDLPNQSPRMLAIYGLITQANQQVRMAANS